MRLDLSALRSELGRGGGDGIPCAAEARAARGDRAVILEPIPPKILAVRRIHAAHASILPLIDRPLVVKRILSHLKLSGGEEPGRPPPPAPAEPHVEPLFDLPYEEPATGE